MKKIFNSIAKFLKVFFLTVGVFSTLYYLSKSQWLGKVKPAVVLSKDDKIALHTTLRGKIRSAEHGGGIWQKMLRSLRGQDMGPYTLSLRSWLEDASKDPQVTGIFFSVEDLHGSHADFAELASLIKSFRDSGKKVHMWLEQVETLNYFLAASSAEKISTSPLADINLLGPVLNQVYFGEALRKLGAEIEVVRNGKYKSAFEPFVSNEPSPDTVEEYRSLEADLRRYLVEQIAAGRGHADREKAKAWLRRSWFSPDEAVTEGMIDEVLYKEDAKAKLAEVDGSKLVDFDDYLDLKVTEERPLPNQDGIALIEAIGQINLASSGGEEGIDPEQMFKEIEWAQNNDRVKAVLLRVNSPGGSALASDLIWDRLARLGEVKPLVASFGSVAASGGYYLGSAAQKIFASESTITGSIGVIGMFVKLLPFEKKFGINFFTYTQSERSNYLNPGKKATEEDRRLLRANSDRVYLQFLSAVADGRKKSADELHQIAQGRVWTGKQGLDHGLVDQIGGLWEAIQETKVLGGFDPNKKVPLLTWEPEILTLSECLNNLERCLPGAESILREGTGLPSERLLLRVSRWLHNIAKAPIQAISPIFLGEEGS